MSGANRKSPLIFTLICSFVQTAFLLSVGIIFLAFPIPAQNLLYPCLSKIEEKSDALLPVNVLEGDAIRLAGACFLAIAISSVGLLVPLLPCCQHGANNATEYLSNYFFLRTLLFMQGSVSLCLVAVGLMNLNISEDDNIYTRPHTPHCSSIKDQTILWIGVASVSLTSFGLMASFWPTSSRVEDDDNVSQQYSARGVIDDVPRITAVPTGKKRWFCWGSKQQQTTTPIFDSTEGLEEPLMVDYSNECTASPNGGESVQEVPPSFPPTDAFCLPVDGDGGNIDEQSTSDQTTSRLRGTSRLLKLAGSESLYLWVGIVVLFIRLPFSLAIPHFVSTTIGSLIDDDYNGAKREVLLLFLIGTVDSVLDFWCIYLFGCAKERIVKTIRVDTFASILRQEQAFFDKTNTGDLISRLTSDCGEMAGDLTWFFRFSIEALVRITGISVYMIIRSPTLAGCTLAIVPVVGIINKFYGDWLGKNAQKVQTALAESTNCAHESLACIKTVITLACEDHECEKYNTKIEKLYRHSIKQLIVSGVYYMAVSTFLINTTVQASLLLLGSIFVEQGKLTPEVLLAFMLYQGQLQEYTLNLFQSYSSLIKSSGAGDRVFFLLDRIPPPPGTGSLIVKSYSEESNDVTNEDITFDNVSFSYPTRRDVLALNKFCLNVKSGSLVALVGQSGSGKSTIISLLERLYDPTEGSIKIGNMDLRSMNLAKHRERIGLVSQDPVLFSGTIAENIGYGSSATFEEISMVSRVANAYDFIERFPNKFNEQVGERGQSLSGGQRQRICIARALVRKPALLLLDEATSALDQESEAAVQEALQELLRNRFGMTTIVVAHRLKTVRSADRIFVMKNGAVVEQGNHEELLQKEGPYRRMLDRVDSTGLLPE